MMIREVHERSAKAWLVGSWCPFLENAISTAFVLVLILSPVLPVERLGQKPTPLVALNLLLPDPLKLWQGSQNHRMAGIGRDI